MLSSINAGIGPETSNLSERFFSPATNTKDQHGPDRFTYQLEVFGEFVNKK